MNSCTKVPSFNTSTRSHTLGSMLEAALSASFLVTNRLMEAQSRALAAHQTVLEAIRMRDTAGARAAMNRLLDIAAEDLQTA